MRSRWLIALVAAATLTATADAGDLWLSCPTGLEISIDGAYVGICRPDMEPTRFGDLEEGVHRLRIGAEPGPLREFAIAVGATPHQVVVAELEAAEAAGTGNIQVYSEPLECTVKVGRLWADKQQPVLTLEGVPAGPHRVWFERYGAILSSRVEVAASGTVRLKADFEAGEVENLDQPSAADDGEPSSETAADDCVEYWIEVLRTSDFEQVEATQEILEQLGFPLYHQKLITVEDDGVIPLYKLRIGPIEDMSMVKLVMHEIKPAKFLGARTLTEPCPSTTDTPGEPR